MRAGRDGAEGSSRVGGEGAVVGSGHRPLSPPSTLLPSARGALIAARPTEGAGREALNSSMYAPWWSKNQPQDWSHIGGYAGQSLEFFPSPYFTSAKEISIS